MARLNCGSTEREQEGFKTEALTNVPVVAARHEVDRGRHRERPRGERAHVRRRCHESRHEPETEKLEKCDAND